jgi:hypothetical protein
MFETSSANCVLIFNSSYNNIYDELIAKKLIIVKHIE